MAVVSILAACLALRVLSDFAWLLTLVCIAMTLFALVRVVREPPTTDRSPIPRAGRQ